MTDPTELPDIIGLYSPFPRMGKSSVAACLVDRFGYSLLKFSGSVKQPLYLLGLSMEEIEGNLKDTPHQLLDSLTPRQKMHEISQSLFKTYGANCLSIILGHSINAALNQGKRVVIDDVRFPENAALIKAYPRAQLWRIYAENVEMFEAYDTGKLEHETFDFYLQASSTLELTHELIQQYFAHVIKQT